MIGYHGKGFSLLTNQTDDYVEIWKKDFESYEKIFTYYPKSAFAAECGYKLAMLQLEKGKTKTAYLLLEKVFEKYSPQTFALESAIIMGNILCGLPNNSYVHYGQLTSYERTQYCREGAEAVTKDVAKGISLYRKIAEKHGEKYRTYEVDNTKMEDVLSSIEERKAVKGNKVEVADKTFKTIALHALALYYLFAEEYAKADETYLEFMEENKTDNQLIVEYAEFLGYKLKKYEKAEEWLKKTDYTRYEVNEIIDNMQMMERGRPIYDNN